MEIIISKFKKFFCLMISFILLSNNIPVFGQQVDMADIFTHYERLENINHRFSDLQRTFSHLAEDYADMTSHFTKYNEPLHITPNYWIKNFIKEYQEIQPEYAYFKELNGKGTDELIEIFSQKYLTNTCKQPSVTLSLVDSEMLDQLNAILHKPYYTSLGNSPNFADAEHAYKHVTKCEVERGNQLFGIEYEKYGQQEYEGLTTYLSECRFTDKQDMKTIKKALDYFKPQLEEMSNTLKLSNQIQNEVIRETITPEKVIKYAYNHIPNEEKTAIKLSFEAIDYDLTLKQMTILIRQHLTEFGNKVKTNAFNKYFVARNLAKKLDNMKILERQEYIMELTEMQPSSKAFIADFETSEAIIKDIEEVYNHSSIKSAGKGFFKRLFPFLVVGAVVTAATISEVSANNNFNNAYTVSARDISKTKTKIENGEATVQELWSFYTDKRNEDLIKQDPVHTLKFVELWQGVTEAEELLLEAEKEYKEQQAKEIGKSVENSILKNYQKQVNKTDFGVSTF